jgi:hypothetical protein
MIEASHSNYMREQMVRPVGMSTGFGLNSTADDATEEIIGSTTGGLTRKCRRKKNQITTKKAMKVPGFADEVQQINKKSRHPSRGLNLSENR